MPALIIMKYFRGQRLIVRSSFTGTTTGSNVSVHGKYVNEYNSFNGIKT